MAGPKVVTGPRLTWAGCAAVAALYFWSPRREASPAYARAMALLLAPLTVVVLAGGAVVAT